MELLQEEVSVANYIDMNETNREGKKHERKECEN